MNYVIIAIILIVALFEAYIDILNYKNRNKPLPQNVKDIYDAAAYKKSLDYSMAKAKYGFVSSSVKTLLIVILLLVGFFPLLESMISGISSSVIIQTLLFLFAFYLIYFMLGIPFGYYRDLVIEEKFGFNKKTKKLFVIDQIKAFLLTVIIGGAMISAVAAIYLLLANLIFVFIGAIFALVSLFMVGAFLTQGWFVRRFNKLTPLEEGPLKTRINDLANRLGFKIHRIFVMDSSKRSTHLNAFFTGLGKTREIVLFDTLLEKMSEDEIVAVLAHELGHASHKDAPKMLLRNLSMMAIYAVTHGLILTNGVFFTSFGLSGIHLGFAVILMMQALKPIEIIFGVYFNFFSRKAEYKADAFAVKHTSKEAITNALVRLTKESFSNLVPHPLYVGIHYSHPPISDRLNAIDKNLVFQHL